MQIPVRAVGIPWYRREDYDRLRALFSDGHKLPTTFDDWQQRALQVEGQVKSSGKIAVRAHIDPQDFPQWCKAQRLRPDAKARIAFASEAAARQHGETH